MLKSKLKLIIPLVLIIAAVVAVIYLYSSRSAVSTQPGQVAGTTRTINSKKIDLNKTFEIAALEQDGRPSKNQIDATIKTVEKTDEILIKGVPATAKNGSRFLVLQVELQNNTNNRLIVSPLDVIRLQVDAQKRAAEVYTEEVPNIRGSVVVEPDSTKVTRVGFVLTEDIVNKQFKLQTGDVNSLNKQTFDLKI